ncbi:membrane bound O-acyl transferase family-domain-containing protein [Mycena amicta]|nr:membrane bound O-acyl transferase family-domain-containing protein [Mycena amicta]
MSKAFAWSPFPYAYFTLYFACIITPLVTNARPRWVFFAPILVLSGRLLYDGQAGYLTSTVWFACLPIASDFLLLTDVGRELYRVEDGSPRRPRRTQRLDEKPLLERLKWALDLFTNARGVGWAHAPRHLQIQAQSRAQDNSRAVFVVVQLVRLSGALILLDLATIHARWNPAFCGHLGLVRAGWVWRVVGTVGWAASAMAGLSLPHLAASIVAVGSGFSQPRDWPPLFGGLEDVASVRTFWARGWHQLLRRPLSAHGKFLATSILRLPPRSLASLCITISSAFLLSGLLHSLGERPSLQRLGYPGGRSGSLWFFGVQPVAIALETLVAVFFRRNPHHALTPGRRRILGSVWVLLWFALTLPLMQDPLLRSGELDPRVDASLVLVDLPRLG